jgi:RNA polymerase sigma factor (sigma-70 family)
MESDRSTCWTLVHNAAQGDYSSRAEFSSRYAPVVRSYLSARWRGSAHFSDADDAVQEVLLECIRQGGLLERAQAGRPGGFRAFLFGAVRNIALRFENREGRRRAIGDIDLANVPDRDDALSKIFDRALARSIMCEAAERQIALAASREDALQRVDLLKLRFQEGLPIREIATLWGVDAEHLHRQYARARKEFHAALRDVVASHVATNPGEVDARCAELLSLLG